MMDLISKEASKRGRSKLAIKRGRLKCLMVRVIEGLRKLSSFN
jgi:hypothetical protein